MRRSVSYAAHLSQKIHPNFRSLNKGSHPYALHLAERIILRSLEATCAAVMSLHPAEPACEPERGNRERSVGVRLKVSVSRRERE